MIWVAGRSPTLVSQNLKATTLTYLAILIEFWYLHDKLRSPILWLAIVNKVGVILNSRNRGALQYGTALPRRWVAHPSDEWPLLRVWGGHWVCEQASWNLGAPPVPA